MEVAQTICNSEREKLFDRFKHALSYDKNLNRKLVSFQANKAIPFYRWFKYKEGFSSNLVKYFIKKFQFQGKSVLDPFAGVGTTLFASAELGCHATGIELLPVGVFAVKSRQAAQKLEFNKLSEIVSNLWTEVDNIKKVKSHIHHIPITSEAFPKETENELNRFLCYCSSLDENYKNLLKFAAYSVLEEISYTRKDGQYLRWDYRSKRVNGKTKFDKGRIIPFREAINKKLSEILFDLNPNTGLTLFSQLLPIQKGKITLFQDSCLTKLADFDNQSFDLVITSPPYCNRYDYTRTYALELVYLGCDNEQVKQLRQGMLSCTVENKTKIKELEAFYSSINRSDDFETVLSTYEQCRAMNEIASFLNYFKVTGKLNNNGVVRMIKNYFLEMAFTVFELSRVLKSGGKIVMVNDNVQYAGEEIPADLILSDFAENFGLTVSNIFVLQQKKGNSSQQMGNHGRTPLRKCVYLWQKS